MDSLFPSKPAEFPTLRPFQVTAHEELRQGAREGHRCQMIMAPTGSGKTVLALNVIREALAKKRRAVFVCDRTTLINQTSAVADGFGMDHGIIQADHWRAHPWKPFQIASAQTLARRQWPLTDVIVVDEAHTQLKAWTERIQEVDAAVIGLSATPFSPGLGKLFTRLINATTMAELVASEVLVPMRVLSCTVADMTGAATAGGEWTDAAAAERELQIVGDVVAEWLRFGENRKTIVFGSTIAHCEELCRQFREQGVPAAVFTSRTDADERAVLLRDFTGPDASLRILISVEALAKGFDVPDVSCVVDCRPLRKSLSTAIQMWGRGLRSAPGKTDCLLLDHSGNIVRFADDFEQVYHNGLSELDDGEKLDKKIRRDEDEKDRPACPKCGYRPFAKRCMACGHERQAAPVAEVLPGVMREVMIGKRKLADDQRHLWEQLAAYARAHSLPEKQQGRAWHLYRDMTGQAPPKGWRVDSTPAVPITATVSNEIRRRNIAFSKRRAA